MSHMAQVSTSVADVPSEYEHDTGPTFDEVDLAFMESIVAEGDIPVALFSAIIVMDPNSGQLRRYKYAAGDCALTHILGLIEWAKIEMVLEIRDFDNDEGL